MTSWKLDTESEAPSETSFRSGWHNLIQLLELVNEQRTVRLSDKHFWHLKRQNTAATRIEAMWCPSRSRERKREGATIILNTIVQAIDAERGGYYDHRLRRPDRTFRKKLIRTSYSVKSLRYSSPSPSRRQRIHQMVACFAQSQSPRWKWERRHNGNRLVLSRVRDDDPLRRRAE